MVRILFTAALYAFLTVSYAQLCREYTACSFEFCNKQSTFKFGASDSAFTGSICIKDTARIGLVQTGEAVLISADSKEFGRTRISRWFPEGLRPNFTDSFFKSYNAGSNGTSGVGHQTPQGNEASYLNNTCWALNLVSYQVKNNDGSIRHVKVSTLPWKNCVAWRLLN